MSRQHYTVIIRLSPALALSHLVEEMRLSSHLSCSTAKRGSPADVFVHLCRLRHLHVYRASANNDASSSPLSRARGRLSACSSLWLPVRRRLGTFCIARRPLILTVWAEIHRRVVDATSMSLRPLCALGSSAPTPAQLQSSPGWSSRRHHHHCRRLLPVSYTHLTLPTNREV